MIASGFDDGEESGCQRLKNCPVNDLCLIGLELDVAAARDFEYNEKFHFLPETHTQFFE